MATAAIGLDTIRQSIGGGSFDPTQLRNELTAKIATDLALYDTTVESKITAAKTAMNTSMNDKVAGVVKTIPMSDASANFYVETAPYSGGTSIVILAANEAQQVTGSVAMGIGSANNISNMAGSTIIGNLVLEDSSSECVGNVLVGTETGRTLTKPLYNCVAIGSQATFTNSTTEPPTATIIDRVAIGHGAVCTNNYSIHLGNDDTKHIYCKQTSITGTSDRRLKEEIQPANLEMCRDTVLSLPVTRYKYKDFTGASTDKHVTGWMADDVEKVFPKAVHTVDRTYRTVDEDGKPTEIKLEAVKHITMTEAAPTMWGALQEAFTEITQLKQEMASLKYQMALLKQK